MPIKRFFFLFLPLLIGSKLNAQFKKGDKMVGTSVASAFFNSGTSNQTVTAIGSVTVKVTGFAASITPSTGWFISEKIAVGSLLNINPTGEKIIYEGSNGNTFQKEKINNFNIGIGGFVRTYFGNAGSFIPFGQITINGGISTLKKEGFVYIGSSPSVDKETYTGKSNGGSFFNTGLTTGLTKMIGEYTGLDFFVGYIFSYNKNTFKRITLVDSGNNGSVDITKENETTTKFTNHGFQFGVGFQIFLTGKK